MKFRFRIENEGETSYSEWADDNSGLVPGNMTTPVRAVVDLRALYPNGVFTLEQIAGTPTPEQQAEMEARWLDGTKVYERPTEPTDADPGDFWIVEEAEVNG